MCIGWEIPDFLYREIINLFNVLSDIFTEVKGNFYWKHRVLSSHNPRDSTRALREKTQR